jgi:hypothetical protein
VIGDTERNFIGSNFQTLPARELYCMLFGERLGGGLAREVYEYLPNKETTVIKVENSMGSFQNVMEWELWNELKDTPLRRWIAPCIRISSNGMYLMMERTTPPPSNYRWPKKIPAWLNDRKRENFGLWKGRLVCHDYGIMHKSFIHGVNLNRMASARWWNASEPVRQY